MKTKVKDLLKYPNFKSFKVLAGKEGLDRDIRYVSVLDAPDGYKWLNGEEFVITTAYMIKDNPDKLRDLIINTEKKGASAFGIKIDRYINKLPKTIINIANELKFPILSIPNNISHAELIHTILSDIINKQTKKLLFSEKIHNSFTQNVIQGGNTQDIINTLFQLVKRDVAFYDNFFNKIYIKTLSKSFKEDVEKNSINYLLEKYKSYKIEVKDEKYGYLFLSNIHYDNKVIELEDIIVESAMTVLILDIQKRLSNNEIQTKYRDKLVQDLIYNNINSIEEVNKRASLYNWSFKNPILSLIVDIDNCKEKYIENPILNESYNDEINNILNICKSIFKQHFNVVYTVFSDKIVFLVQIIENNKVFTYKLKGLCNDIRRKIKSQTNYTVIIGIGSYKDSVVETYKSFQESLKAVNLGRKIYTQDTVVFYDDLRIYRLLDSITDQEYIDKYSKYYLEAIIKYDEKHNTSLLKTLRCLIENDWNMNETANKLFIHYNTMKYRVNRISKIMNIDINDAKNKLNIDLALKLLDLK